MIPDIPLHTIAILLQILKINPDADYKENLWLSIQQPQNISYFNVELADQVLIWNFDICMGKFLVQLFMHRIVLIAAHRIFIKIVRSLHHGEMGLWRKIWIDDILMKILHQSTQTGGTNLNMPTALKNPGQVIFPIGRLALHWVPKVWEGCVQTWREKMKFSKLIWQTNWLFFSWHS